MRFPTRAFGLAALAALTATVALFRPGAVPVATAAQPPELPADLALVPADALGFVHIRAAEIWKHDLLAVFRQTFEKAGPKVLAALDEQFVPKISTLDRVTGFLMLHKERHEPLPFVVFRFNAPFDPEEVLKAYMPKAEKVTVGGKTAYGGGGPEFALHFPDKQHIVLAPPQGMLQYLGHAMPKEGPLSAGLKLAAAGKPVVGSLDIASLPIPPKELEQVPPEVKPLLKAQHLTGSLDLENGATMRVTVGYKTADDAQAAEKALKALADHLRKEFASVREQMEKQFLARKGVRPAGELPDALAGVFGIGAMNYLDELLANPGVFVKRDGANLTASVTFPKELFTSAAPTMIGLTAMLLPAVQKVRQAAARTSSANNLKQLALGILNYESANGHLPNDIVDKNGKPILSWRVAILPYIEQENVYRKFDLTKAWDDPVNKPWSQLAIKTFVSPQVPLPNPAGLTNYQGFAGPGTLFEPGKKIKFADITDGTSNTLLLVETAEAVEWAKPGGLPFDPKKALPKMTSPYDTGIIQVAMCDGSVRALNFAALGEKSLKALITRDGGEVLGNDR